MKMPYIVCLSALYMCRRHYKMAFVSRLCYFHGYCLPTLVSSSWALDNGLARTPPMGWLSWLAFGCNVDCDKQPNNCLNEALIKRTADRMVSDGYLAAGYEYVVIDDCWLEKNRSAGGRMVPDRKRFPSGMKALADYVHSKGLKFGMYQDIGTKTCEEYPGLQGHEKTDVETFVSWEVDYLKIDGCFMEAREMDKAYPAFGKLLNESGRPIVYSCSWPAYQDNPNYKEIAKHCNLWRNYADISASWKSLLDIMDFFGNRSELAQYGQPGQFNDPDMLIIGNPGPDMNLKTYYAQLTVWSILAAPLFMSVDLDKLDPTAKHALLDTSFIKINQDPMGKPGIRTGTDKIKKVDFWKRSLSNGAFFSAVVDRLQTPREETEYPEFTFDEFKIPPNTYRVEDLIKREEPFILEIGPYGKSKTFSLKPYGVAAYKLSPIRSTEKGYRTFFRRFDV